jgi:hypothetical protein
MVVEQMHGLAVHTRRPRRIPVPFSGAACHTVPSGNQSTHVDEEEHIKLMVRGDACKMHT